MSSDEEQLSLERLLERQTHETTVILESLRSGFVSLDLSWRVTYINSTAARLFVSSPTDLIGRDLWDILPNLKGTPLEAQLQAAASGVTAAFDVQPTVGGRWYEVNVATHHSGLAVSFIDITVRKELEASLQRANDDLERRVMQRTAELTVIAYQDPLTHLSNRRAFEDDFEHLITGGAPSQLLLFDVDNLKQVNDVEGHDQGDVLLISFAKALMDAFAGEGKAYRLGGDEFAVLVPGHGIDLNEINARNVTLQNHLRLHGFSDARASVGLASFPTDTRAPNDLVRLADQRMLRDKASRRVMKRLGREDLNVEANPLPTEMMWQALRAVSALISQDGVIDQVGWQAFLNAAVAALPGAEAGSLYVREGEVFVMRAQVGFSDALLGVGHSTTSMRAWYGEEMDWTAGDARVLRGVDTVRTRSHATRDEPSTDTDPTIFDELGDLSHLNTNLAVPVVVSGEVVAILNLDNLRTPHAYRDRELKIAEELARQAAAILASHERQARAAARTQELEILAQANAALSLVQTVEDIERVLVAETKALLRTEHVVYIRNPPEAPLLQLVWPSGDYLHVPHHIPREKSAAWHAMEHHAVIHMPYAAARDRAYQDIAPITGSLLIAPVAADPDAPMGALMAVRPSPGSFSALDGRVLGALASAGIAASHRVNAAAEQRRRTEELQMLAELAQRVGVAESVRTVTEQCLVSCREFLDADAALFVSAERQIIISSGTTPEAFPVATGMPADRVTALVDVALNAHASWATHDYQQWAGANPAFVSAGVRAMVQVPVIERGRSVGVLLLVWFRPLNALPVAALPLATRAAELLGQVLDREAHIRDIEATREGALLALGLALELRDFETAGHTERVVAMALQLGDHLGLNEEQLEDLRVGAYLHDIGKLSVPDAILLKPGALNDDEWHQMRRHSMIGAELVSQIPTVLAGARRVVRHHHERWDGTGYPDGLSGTTIPLEARIFTVADVYDALTSVRPYKPAWTQEDAMHELRAQAGRQFDPEVVDAALAALGGVPERTGGPSSTSSRLRPERRFR